MESRIICREGWNCWRRPHAERAAFLIDAAAYFSIVAEAMARARHSIFIIGWDIDSRLRLRRSPDSDASTPGLGEFLNGLARRRPDLHIFILSWDFAVIYLFERELLPVFRFEWLTHPRIRFRMDGQHPRGASQHQKIVVIDDAMAFCGGIDLTAHRWDTPEHRSEDPRRIDPSGSSYGPFHDVHMAVTGEAARVLGALARERWQLATGRSAPALGAGGDPWPPDLAADLEGVHVAIARTSPPWNGRGEVREVERLYLDMIASARRSIYIENQYLTAGRIARALAARLQEEDGPEVVIVYSRNNSGWLEQNTMGGLRFEFLKILKEADRFRRLHLYHPVLPGNVQTEVHSKVMVIDEDSVRIGSANLNNRSLTLDTECDLMIESTGEEKIQGAIARFRNRLLGEHLGAPLEEVERAMAREGSVSKTIAVLGGAARTLTPAAPDWEMEPAHICLSPELCDPERPVSAEMVLEYMLPQEIHSPARTRLVVLALLLIAVFGLTAGWHYLALNGLSGRNPLLVLAETGAAVLSLRPILVIGAYLVGGLVAFPIILLQLATFLVFGPLMGLLYSFFGTMGYALLTFLIGRMLGRETARRLAGKHINVISRRLARHGALTLFFMRLLPIAPFTVVNVVAGASRVTLYDFLMSTLAGIVPGLLFLALFGTLLSEALHHPGLRSFLLLGAVSAGTLLLLFSLHRLLAKFEKRTS